MLLSERWEAMSEDERQAVLAIHAVLRAVKANPELYADPVQFIEDMEFTLQGLWKFDRSVNHHIHWIDIKGCTCPRMDNKDHWGTGRITISDCKWHWKEPEPKTYVVAAVSSSCDHYLDTYTVQSPWDLVDAMKERHGEEFYYLDQIDITSPDGGQAERAQRYVRDAIEEGEDE
ncbi:hypothetical protein uav_129 [Pseudomonas phage UAVern]|uniref:Uncharacterized protein n=1 Tax=Pseudomonas phage UAVern TaxID=2856997 RepID=A0A975YYL1_9CAUD|nr:hypothetical protein uav_129 [Pseudomonas phage UAVern]